LGYKGVWFMTTFLPPTAVTPPPCLPTVVADTLADEDRSLLDDLMEETESLRTVVQGPAPAPAGTPLAGAGRPNPRGFGVGGKPRHLRPIL
jgi:hypothetical protein